MHTCISLPEVPLRVKETKIEAPETTTIKKKSVDELPGTFSDRVFIGGAYREGLLDQKLRKIELVCEGVWLRTGDCN